MPNRSSLSPHRFLIPLTALIAVAFALALLASPPAAAAPIAQILPTAEACAAPVLEPSSTVINARTGPGPNYPIRTELYEGQSYPIAGRHAGFRWWAVNLPDGQTGWVWDSIVLVSGNIDAVPLLQAPQLNGIIPITQDIWTPTSASPPCVPTPTPDATPEAVSENGATPRLILAAQDDGPSLQSEWSEPANLSNSGGAENPAMILDDAGRFRIYWDDEFVGNFLVEGDRETWSAPISTTTPFSGTVPILLEAGNETPIAIWVDRSEDSNILQVASAIDSEVSEEETWNIPQILDEAVLNFDAVLDSNGEIHLLYSRSSLDASRRAGIYYLNTEDQGLTWSEPVLLFESPYFRSLRVQDTSISLQTTTDGAAVYLYAAWDVRNRKRVYFTRSTDGGASWQDPTEISGPESTSSIILPFNPRIGVGGSNVLLVWQIGQPAGACQQYYQWSTDHGATWTMRQQINDMLPGVATCAHTNEIFHNSDLYYLLSAYNEQAFLLAWNGDRWSQPQAQRPLNQFNNPETLNTVNLGCLQSALTPDNYLYVAGCDVTALNTSESDIWFLSRSLGDTTTWFPTPDQWSGMTSIVEGETVAHYPQLVSDSGALTHALWVQRDAPGGNLNRIYHSQWDGNSWTQPSQIISTSGPVAYLDAAARADGQRAYLLWTTTTGEVFISHAEAGQLQAATSWAPPAMAPLMTRGASAPAMTVDSAGTLHVAYATSINEDRGVYLLSSTDNGQTWSNERQLFDAQAAGWEIVGPPAINVAPDGVLHLSFDQRQWTVDTSTTSTGLYYVQCSDLDTCANPVLITESETLWSDLVALDNTNIHHLWLSRSADGVALQHQASTDGGSTWNRANTLTIAPTGAPAGDAAIAAGAGGHLFAFATTGGALQSWIWESEAWRPDSTLYRPLSSAIDQELTATLSPGGELIAAYTDERPQPLALLEEDGDQTEQYALIAIERMIDASAPSPTATVTADSTSQPPATAIAPTQVPTDGDENGSDSEEPIPDIEATLPSEPAPEGNAFLPFLDSSNPVTFLIFSLVPVLIVVGIAVIIGLRRNAQRRN